MEFAAPNWIGPLLPILKVDGTIKKNGGNRLHSALASHHPKKGIRPKNQQNQEEEATAVTAVGACT